MVKRRGYRKNRRKESPVVKRAKRTARLAGISKAAVLVASVFAMSALFIFGHDLLTQCEYFKAEKIKIEGAERLSASDVMEQAGVRNGINILAINLSVTRKKLIAHPWIENARVGREFPGTIFIRIKEQEPLAVMDLGAKFIVNKKGEIFKTWEPSDPANLPEVTGLSFSDMRTAGEKGSVRYESVMEVLYMGLESTSIIPNAVVRRIDVDRQMGLSLYSSTGEKVIRLGFENYPGKYARLQRVIFHLKSREEFTDYNSIDLTNPDSIVVYPAKNNNESAKLESEVTQSKKA